MDETQQLKLLFGVIDKITSNNPIDYDNIKETKERIIEQMEECLDDVNYDLIEYNINKYFKPVFIKNTNFKGKIIYDKDDMIIPKKYKPIIKQLRKISQVPQPEQRTPEWFDKRMGMLTASTAAAALNECKYSRPKDIILDKLGEGKFFSNKYTHHGNKYEDIATKLYEVIYNVCVDEYGLIPHLGNPPVTIVGASPDGITNQFKLDNSFNDKLGRMIEIKVPPSRVIKTNGAIHGEICPHHYWCQIQQQLECCDLKECDFWQCNIIEYETREEWLNDDVDSVCTEEQNKPLYLPKNCMKGVILQFIPKKKAAYYSAAFSAKYIYPETVDMTLFEYDTWTLDIINNLRVKHKELMKDFIFDRVIYWKLSNCHNVLIKRDRDWFEESLPKFKELWNKIEFLRANPKEGQKFIDSCRRKKHVDSDEEFCIDSDSSD